MEKAWAAAVPDTEIPGWYAQDASFSLLTEGTLNPNRKAALRTTFAPGGKIYNIGYFGVPVKEGEEYHFYFFVQSDAAAGLTVALESEEGVSLGSSRLTLQKSGGYLRYDCDLTACGTDFKGRISISCDASSAS